MPCTAISVSLITAYPLQGCRSYSQHFAGFVKAKMEQLGQLLWLDFEFGSSSSPDPLEISGLNDLAVHYTRESDGHVSTVWQQAPRLDFYARPTFLLSTEAIVAASISTPPGPDPE